MSNDNKLIENYEVACKKLKRARMSVSGLILSLILGFALISICTVKDFAKNDIAQVASLVVQNFSNDSANYSALLSGAVNRILPVYQKALSSQIEKDTPLVQAAVQRETELFYKHVENKWPEFDREINELAKAQQMEIQTALAKVVGQDQAEKIKNNYGEAISAMVEDLANQELKTHAAAGRGIGQNLYLLLETESDLPKPVDLNEAVGLLLELAGVELQNIRGN
jgi:hypothetical protein